MADSTLELKRKISSINKTGQITTAMQMVSGVKLNQTEKINQSYIHYQEMLYNTVAHLMAARITNELGVSSDSVVDDENFDYASLFRNSDMSDLISHRPVKKTGYLVITGDRGLVGSYNSTAIKQMMSLAKQAKEEGREAEILAVGGVGADFFKKQGMNLVYEFRGISDVPTFEESREIVSTAVNMYMDGVYDELYVCYTHHINTISSEFRTEKMLPISDIDIQDAVHEGPKAQFITEPSTEAVLDRILPQFAQGMIYGAILDSKTAEHASSMTAMQNASKNADSVVSDLTTQLNRARQAQITTEITEIVGGAAAQE
ncbi:F0F1 ATP synthase subunit gamma [Holzapfeliella sp. He02]|uniref:ATP synthase gamma chain n=1 Tax=Holzapfeliella saturejae TaxID=3082953 RepID=A0ABU8SFY9_9LACO